MRADPTPAVGLVIDPAALDPLLDRAFERLLVRLDEVRDRLGGGDRLAFSEREAAALLGVRQHQLRDARLAGKVVGSRLMGNKVFYSKADLVAYLAANRTDAA